MFYRDENNEWQEIILEPSGDTLPVGAITQFGGETAPTNWLICNGQAVSRTDFAELFSAIGTTYGEGDGSTTFNIPDFIGRVPVGLDAEDTAFDTLGETGGEKTHKLLISEIPSHNHNMNWNAGQNPGTSAVQWTNATASQSVATENTGGSQAHNNLQPYTTINFIIKAKQSIGIVGTVSEDITDTNNNAVPTCETVKDYVDKGRQVATIYLSSAVSNIGASKIPFNTIKSNSDELTLYNNGIKIGKNINQVIVSGNVFLVRNNSPYLWTKIFINSDTSGNETSVAIDNADSGFASTTHAPRLLDVEEGDVIYMRKIDDDTGELRGKSNTYLTVEVVG